MKRGRKHRAPLHAGFALIELLVSIAIVAVLVLIGATGLARVRESGHEAATPANLRTHHAVFSMYANDHAGWTPLLGEPPAPEILFEAGGIWWLTDYFAQTVVWHIALTEGYYDTHLDPQLFLSPKNPAQNKDWGAWGMTVSDYQYPAVFLARPEYWDYATHTGPEQWGGNRLDEVLYPAHKVLIREDPILEPVLDPHRPPRVIRRRPAVTVAGEAAAFTDPLGRDNIFLKGDGGYDGAPLITGQWALHTRYGVRGRDLR